MKPSRFILLQILLALLVLIAGYFMLNQQTHTAKWLFAGAVLLASVSSVIVYALIYRGLKIRPKSFFTSVVGSMFLRMGAGVVSIFLVSQYFRDHLKLYAVSFMLSYFLFTGIEVFLLVKQAKNPDS